MSELASGGTVVCDAHSDEAADRVEPRARRKPGKVFSRWLLPTSTSRGKNTMPPTKTPTSSLSVIELLTKRVWYRTPAVTRKMWSTSPSPQTFTTCPSPAAQLPLETVEMIIGHLTHDTRSLLACSLTCYSWYIAAVPHLHRTLITITPTYPRSAKKKFSWPGPLRNMHKLGLLPLVKRFQIRKDALCFHGGFSRKQLNCFTMRHFFALTNVQELGMEYLDIPSFMPKLRRYFWNFLPTVRSLALREPKGSRRQILYFIGLFEHLQDLKLLYDRAAFQMEPADDQTPNPPFVPPLRGRLTMMYLTRVGLLEDMIDRFGGIRFHYMDLFYVDGMRLLLDSCAETLETLRLYPADPRATSSLRDFDLSRNKSLRALEIRARYLADTHLLAYALSTITSPVFSKVIAFYRDLDFRGVEPPFPDSFMFRQLSPTERAEEALWHEGRFKVFRAMHGIRDVQLVLCADVWDTVREYAVQMLRQAVAAEKAKRGFDSIFPEPLVVYSSRGSRQELTECGVDPSPWVPL